MELSRSKKPLIFFISVLFLTLIAVFLLVKQCSGVKPTKTIGDSSLDDKNPDNGADSISLIVDGKHVDENSTARSGTPEELVGEIRDLIIKANDSGNVDPLINFLGKSTLTDAQTEHLQNLAARSRLRLNTATPFSSVKDLPGRWALNLADRQRILLDLAKNTEGKWQVNRVTLPDEQGNTTAQGGLDVANPDDEAIAAAAVNNFIEAILKLDPSNARSYVDTSKVSYAKLASLCIIFEEGEYKLVKNRAVRKMFLKENSAGWLTRVESNEAQKNAVFAVTTKRKDNQSPWKITEVNLDQLLADYAGRFSDGDIHYTPLIKNPKGGDSLAIYFDLDSGDLTTRTQRQLNIVANLLINDTDKKLTISGHTDALGSDAHNLQLSEKRAKQVMKYLTEQGVKDMQISVIGYGKSQPRRPNTTKDGEDAPDGRRANRRAEILLSF